MVGVTSVQVKENLEDLTERLRQAKTLKAKERLQVLNLAETRRCTQY